MARRAPNTKRRIMDAALALFSVKGYDPVTVAEIADAVGVKAPSLYKHYKSKKDIFEAILSEMDARYQEHMSLTNLDGNEAEKDEAFYAAVSEDELVRFGLALFHYFLHDEYAGKFRRMLTLSQYTNRELSDLFVRRYFENPLTYQEKSFRFLSQAGRLIRADPRVMALQYCAPTFLLLSLCDRCPDMEGEAFAMQERHIRQFIRLYGTIDTE